MGIEITERDLEAIRKHGEETFPYECCGFMLGKANGETKEVLELLRAENDREADAQHNRFLISPDAYMKGDKQARQRGMDIVGFYHSHPNAPARPSQYDLDHAWPWFSYVIVSIQESRADAMTSWVLAEDRSEFNEEPIVAKH